MKILFSVLNIKGRERKELESKDYTFCSDIKLYNGLWDKIKMVNIIKAMIAFHKMTLKKHNKKITLGVQLKSPQIATGASFQSLETALALSSSTRTCLK